MNFIWLMIIEEDLQVLVIWLGLICLGLHDFYMILNPVLLKVMKLPSRESLAWTRCRSGTKSTSTGTESRCVIVYIRHTPSSSLHFWDKR